MLVHLLQLSGSEVAEALHTAGREYEGIQPPEQALADLSTLSYFILCFFSRWHHI